MNEANKTVREATREVIVEILAAIGVQPEEVESHFGEGSEGAALELRLTRFASAIVEQARPRPPIQSSPCSDRGHRLQETLVERQRGEVMSDNVNRFCDSVHEKLATLDNRMHSLKLNIGTTWHFLQEKIAEMGHKGEATKQAIADARINLKQWLTEKKAETKDMIDRWVETRETQKLSARAQRAEDYAGIAIVIAQASIDDAERLILEAIAARRDAEAVMVAEAKRSEPTDGSECGAAG